MRWDNRSFSWVQPSRKSKFNNTSRNKNVWSRKSSLSHDLWGYVNAGLRVQLNSTMTEVRVRREIIKTSVVSPPIAVSMSLKTKIANPNHYFRSADDYRWVTARSHHDGAGAPTRRSTVVGTPHTTTSQYEHHQPRGWRVAQIIRSTATGGSTSGENCIGSPGRMIKIRMARRDPTPRPPPPWLDTISLYQQQYECGFSHSVAYSAGSAPICVCDVAAAKSCSRTVVSVTLFFELVVVATVIVSYFHQ